MKKGVSIIVVIIGIILFVVGLGIKVPNKELTTLSILSDEYSVIDEYVGGDAYNYIIGASLVGGEISGVKTQKAMFESIGLLIMCVGLLSFAHSSEDKTPVLALDKPNETLTKQTVIDIDNTVTNDEVISTM
ncbi:MAG: hypothetical protein MRZ66_01610 [Clostridiales bacterium]|nr:hypothetical protein [Clostridiales bacterium]